jgi:hypothetical protein
MVGSVLLRGGFARTHDSTAGRTDAPGQGASPAAAEASAGCGPVEHSPGIVRPWPHGGSFARDRGSAATDGPGCNRAHAGGRHSSGARQAPHRRTRSDAPCGPTSCAAASSPTASSPIASARTSAASLGGAHTATGPPASTISTAVGRPAVPPATLRGWGAATDRVCRTTRDDRVEELDAGSSPRRRLHDRGSERPISGHDGDHVSAVRLAVAPWTLRDVRVRAPGAARADDRPGAGVIEEAAPSLR